jgi:hypothetical protein
MVPDLYGKGKGYSVTLDHIVWKSFFIISILVSLPQWYIMDSQGSNHGHHISVAIKIQSWSTSRGTRHLMEDTLIGIWISRRGLPHAPEGPQCVRKSLIIWIEHIRASAQVRCWAQIPLPLAVGPYKPTRLSDEPCVPLLLYMVTKSILHTWIHDINLSLGSAWHTVITY